MSASHSLAQRKSPGWRFAELSAQAALAEVLAASEVAKKARDIVIAPALALYDKYDFDEILDSFWRAANRGYSGKDMARLAQSAACTLKIKLSAVDLCLEPLNDLCRVSLNRPDKIKDCVTLIRETMFSGLELC